MNEEAKLKITRARINMIMKQPFFGTLALRLNVIERDTLNPPTLATNGTNLYYHPQWVLDNDQALVESGLAHEVGHCVFQHIGRRGGRTARRWNCAGDYVINATLKDSGFTIGANWLYSPVYDGMTTDAVYQALPPDDEDGNGPGQDPFDAIDDSSVDGSGAIDADWEVAAVQAATAAQAAGKLSGTLKRFIDDIIRPKADWRAVMSRFATEVSREDYSYARVNRKFASLGIFLPGLYSESMGEMAACIDTSGSITKDVLNAFGAHLSEIKDQMKPVLTHVLYCDADMNHADRFEQYDDMHFEPHGGGGTDFRPPFAYMEQHGITPKCFMYLTDGYGPFPATPPEFPVLWLMTTDVVPPWGEVVRIEA
jgi:predicted metal-dependent peptidase